MDGAGRTLWLVADPDDPWVTRLGSTLPDRILIDWNDDWDQRAAPDVLVLHRVRPGLTEPGRVASWRSSAGSASRVILVAGPHGRQADLDLWNDVVDVLIPEAIAPFILGRYVGDDLPKSRSLARQSVQIISPNHDLRLLLRDVCGLLGFESEESADWPGPGDRPATGLVIWDAPVLEPRWWEPLERHGRSATILALLGFADRATVTQAMQGGASACLELPWDLADLRFVLEHLASRIPAELGPNRHGDPAHELPPPPASRSRRVTHRHEPPR